MQREFQSSKRVNKAFNALRSIKLFVGFVAISGNYGQKMIGSLTGIHLSAEYDLNHSTRTVTWLEIVKISSLVMN